MSTQETSLPGVIRGTVTSIALHLARPHALVPSSTPGHAHLYVDVLMTWRAYRRLLHDLHAVGVLESGFLRVAMQHEATHLFLPWVRKTAQQDQTADRVHPADIRWGRAARVFARDLRRAVSTRPASAPITGNGGLLVLGEPGVPGVPDRAVPGTLDRRLYVRTDQSVMTDYFMRTPARRLLATTDVNEAEIVSSRLRHGYLHAPTLDIDVRHTYDPVAGILVLHLPMSLRDHRRLARAVRRAGIGEVESARHTGPA